MIHHAMRGVDMRFKLGYNFNKAGVIVEDIVPAGQVRGVMGQREQTTK